MRFLAVSTHQRTLVPQIAAANDFDIVHFRYNAAHPGAEDDIFPQLPAANRPGLVAFTASVGDNFRDAPIPDLHGQPIPKGERVPTATDCYRYVLSRPEVDVCMTGPSNAARMDEASRSVAARPDDGRRIGLDAPRGPGGSGKIGRHFEPPSVGWRSPLTLSSSRRRNSSATATPRQYGNLPSTDGGPDLRLDGAIGSLAPSRGL